MFKMLPSSFFVDMLDQASRVFAVVHGVSGEPGAAAAGAPGEQACQQISG